MYLCNSLQDGVCLEWVSYQSLFILPDGAGLKIGGFLFLCSAIAFVFRYFFKFIRI